jgi:hypothetical protein
MITKKGSAPTYYGTSLDDKPLNVIVNSKYKELDTGDTYYFTGEAWQKIGGTSNGSNT